MIEKENDIKIDDINIKISQFLREEGVPTHIKGFGYLKEAIAMCCRHSEYLHGMAKKLYPQIAENNNDNTGSVQRALQHAINKTNNPLTTKEYITLATEMFISGEI